MTINGLEHSKIESLSPITTQAVKEVIDIVENNKIISLLLGLILVVLIFLTIGVYRLKK